MAHDSHNQSIDYLCFDINNVLYRTFYANKSEDDTTLAGLAGHAALLTLNKYFRKFKPTEGVVMCFDRPNWRKDYTKSDKCLSKKIYKGNRRQNMTKKEEEKFKRFVDHITEFELLMREHTSVITLAGDGLEADDFVAGFAQAYSNDFNIIIISSDQDLIQLLRYPNVRLIDPVSGKDRTLEDWNNDADLFMFEKNIRGDRGDNVQSAYPRIRKTKIIEAYNDDYIRTNIMNFEWTNENNITFKVQDLFKENQLLMDLEMQPDEIRFAMMREILQQKKNPGSYNHFNFLRFLGKYDLHKIATHLENFIPLLSR